MSDLKRTVLDEMVAARELLDTMVNSFAPSDDDEEAEVRALRARSEALTAMINEALARPIPELSRAVEERVVSLKAATARLQQVNANILGVKEAIGITDEILKIAAMVAPAIL